MNTFNHLLIVGMLLFSVDVLATSPETCGVYDGTEEISAEIEGSDAVIIALSTGASLNRFEELNKNHFKEKSYTDLKGSYAIAIPDHRVFKFLAIQNIKGNMKGTIEVESLVCGSSVILGEPNILFLSKNNNKYYMNNVIGESNPEFKKYLDLTIKFGNDNKSQQ